MPTSFRLLLCAFLLTACVAAPAATSVTVSTPTPSAFDALVAAAQAEGSLNTIALPHDWCNYGELIQSFQTTYGIHINELMPNAGSAEELDAIRATMTISRSEAPDVVDIGYGYTAPAMQEGLLAPYKVMNWETIPAGLKDPTGYWYGNYYGVLAFEVNTALVKNVPQDWADLLKPEYAGQVALSGDPRVSNQAFLSVYASALASGGSLDDAQAGLGFFKRLHEAGSFVPVIALTEQITNGRTPIVIRWDYLGLGDRDSLAGKTPIEVVLPKSGVLGGVYASAISAYAPHPNAAKLWMEYLYSDKGQVQWLTGYCHPVRFDDLVRRQVIPANLLAKLPPADLYRQAVFPTVAQQNAAQKLISENWTAVVGVDVVAP